MGVEGIGARVARKEDKRFLTGKGRYTDDMVVPGMKYALFRPQPACACEDHRDRRVGGTRHAGRDWRAGR